MFVGARPTFAGVGILDLDRGRSNLPYQPVVPIVFAAAEKAE